LADRLEKINGVKIINNSFFNEFTIELPISAKEANKKLLSKNIIGGLALSNEDEKQMVVNVTELTSQSDIEIFAQELEKII
jgi:glycine dehydrogenase subunit 1